MNYDVTLVEGAFASNMHGVRVHWEGKARSWPSKKYPNHLYLIGYFRNPPPGSSPDLRRATRNALKDIFVLFDNASQRLGLPLEIDWPHAKEKATAALASFQEWATVTTPANELEWYKQALEIIDETIDFVLGQGDRRKEYRLEWHERYGPDTE